MPTIVGPITGPSTVVESTTSNPFTVSNADAPTYIGVLIPNDGGFGGTFTPSTITFTGVLASFMFRYNAPAATGTAVVTVTNVGGDATAPSSLNVAVTGSIPPTVFTQQGYNQVVANEPLDAGTITNTGATSSTLSFTATDATGGDPPYSYQWTYRLHGIGSYTNFGTDAITPQVLTGLTASTAYDIQLTYTDSASNVVEAYLLDVTTQASATSGNIQNIIVIPQGLQATGTAVKLVN
jgi:hypothetical protein